VTARSLPDRTIALTFDDGPDPTWTPEVLSILRKYQVAVTFFVGATSHSDLIRQIHDSGSELGNHTFTHPNLVEMSTSRVDRELDQTQLALAGAAGVTSYLFRPPFSSSNSAIDNLSYGMVKAAGALGCVSVSPITTARTASGPGSTPSSATPPRKQARVGSC
jgi:peptidoglycan/xylan/chitin deacetylase (PgdA/CDA1 family)